jgi:hypothetical protein
MLVRPLMMVAGLELLNEKPRPLDRWPLSDPVFLDSKLKEHIKVNSCFNLIGRFDFRLELIFDNNDVKYCPLPQGSKYKHNAFLSLISDTSSVKDN